MLAMQHAVLQNGLLAGGARWRRSAARYGSWAALTHLSAAPESPQSLVQCAVLCNHRLNGLPEAMYFSFLACPSAARTHHVGAQRVAQPVSFEVVQTTPSPPFSNQYILC